MKPLAIYVAGSSAEIDRARAFIDAARAIPGVIITMDWPAFVAASGAVDADLGEDRLREGAEADIRGVITADLVFFLVPTLVSRGLQTELGIAIAECKHTIAVADRAVADLDVPPVQRGLGLFGVLVNDWIADDALALEWLRGFAARAA